MFDGEGTGLFPSLTVTIWNLCLSLALTYLWGPQELLNKTESVGKGLHLSDVLAEVKDDKSVLQICNKDT